jgi:hemerythrin superfamily protein
MPNLIDNIAAKSAGKVGAVQGMTKGLKGVFVTLAEQHHEALVLLSRAGETNDAEKRRVLWTEIKKQLVSHERAELAEIYPALSSDPRTEDIVRAHAAEAGELERTINQVDATSFDSPAWHRQIENLIALVKNHVSEEEDEFFPRAQEVLGKGGAKRLEKPFISTKEREMSSMQSSH